MRRSCRLYRKYDTKYIFNDLHFQIHYKKSFPTTSITLYEATISSALQCILIIDEIANHISVFYCTSYTDDTARSALSSILIIACIYIICKN